MRALSGQEQPPPARVPTATWAALLVAVVGCALPLLVLELPEAGSAQLSEQLIFIGLNYTLFLYLTWEVWRVVKEESVRAFLQPAVLASVIHFGVSYLLPNTRYFTPEGFGWLPVGLTFVHKQTYGALTTATWMTMLAAFAMWRGYRASLGPGIAARLRKMLHNNGIVHRDADVNFVTLAALIAVSVAALLLSVRLGVFGYSLDFRRLSDTQSIRGWLNLANNAGSLSLLVIAAAAYSPRYRHNVGVQITFVALLSWRVMVGFLSGFKSQVVLPFIIAGAAYFAIRKRVSMAWILFAALMMPVAFHVVDSFRERRNNDPNFDGTSIGSIVSTVAEASVEGPGRARGFQREMPTWARVAGRMELSSYTAEGIAFEQRFGTPPGSPDFLGSIIRAPLNAYIPRALWPDKEVFQSGWFNLTVLGASGGKTSAVAMGPVAQLNFAGGYWMVALGFFFIGLLQRIVWETFRDSGLGGWLIYLSLLSGLVRIPTDVGAFLASFLREVPFVVVAQYLVLRRGESQPQELQGPDMTRAENDTS